MNQKQIFLEAKADAWFERNKIALTDRDCSKEDSLILIIKEVADLSSVKDPSKIKVLEVECGDGGGLAWIRKNMVMMLMG